MSSQPRTTVVDGRPVSLMDVDPRLGRAMTEFMRVAYPGKVDIVTRELVRIYSGRKSNCSICRNLRLKVAIERGFDESMVEHLDDLDTSDLDPRRKAALRLAQAFFGDPHSFSTEAQEDLMKHFTPEQVAELLLDLIRYRPGSKLTVASGTEPPVDELIYS